MLRALLSAWTTDELAGPPPAAVDRRGVRRRFDVADRGAGARASSAGTNSSVDGDAGVVVGVEVEPDGARDRLEQALLARRRHDVVAHGQR